MFVQFYILVLIFQFSKCIFVFSPSNTMAFKNYAVLSTEININPYNRDEKCIFLDLYALHENYKLCLLYNDVYSHRMIKETTVILPKSNMGSNIHKLDEFNLTCVRGYVVEKPFTSSLSGYIHNKMFFGKFQMDKRMFYIEPLSKFKIVSKSYDNAETLGVLYEAEDIDTNFIVEENDLTQMFEQSYNFTIGKLAQKPLGYIKDNIEQWKGRSCTGALIIDYTFFKEIAESNIDLTLMMVINSFIFLNNIFETTDFDMDSEPDDVGFILKHIIILDTVEVHNVHFKHETVHAVDGSKYLDMFSKFETPFFSETCFELLLTAQPFLNNILSISHVHPHAHLWLKDRPTAGICRKPPFNKLIVTNYLDYGDYVPILMMDLALIHEMGHMFGGIHDDESNCFASVMNPKLTPLVNTKRYFTFSNCSKADMLRYLKSSGHCLYPWNTETHCGNGLIEVGEECDCGLSFDCNTKSYCCIAHNGKDNPCGVDRKGGFDCVPNQGFCCNHQCQYNDLSNYNIDCENENKRCPCRDRDSFCRCGHSGICIGSYCHSQECVYSGLLECICPIMDNQDCATCCVTNEGQCLPLSQIKEVYINNSNPLLRELKNVQFINYNNLAHMIWKRKEVCISFGKTGFCDNGVCDLIAPSIILNKMDETVDSLKPFYEEHMEKHIPNRIRRKEPEPNNDEPIVHEEARELPIPFMASGQLKLKNTFFILLANFIFMFIEFF